MSALTQTPTVGTYSPFAAVAMSLQSLGWRGTVPLPHGSKFPPESGWTGGKAGRVYPSGADVQEWIDERADRAQNICIRLPEDVVGIDVDAYTKGDVVKVGDQTLAKAIEAWGPLPATWMSTSRNDGASGIRLYRVPAGLAWPGKVGDSGIDVIHANHRYVVCAPSLHPEGRTYRWVGPDGREAALPCRPDELPPLPTAWVEGLTRGRQATERVSTGARVGDYLGALRVDQEMCQLVEKALSDLCDATKGGNRHDDVRDAVLRLIRFGSWGHSGVSCALDTGFSVWMAAMSKERGTASARGEWARMVDGAVDLVGVRGHDVVCRCGQPAPGAASFPTLAAVTTLPTQRQGEVPGKAEAPGAEEAPGGGSIPSPTTGIPSDVDQHAQEVIEQARAQREAIALDEEVQKLRRQARARQIVEEERKAAASEEAVAKLREQMLTSATLDSIPELAPLVEGWIWHDTMFRIIGASNSYKSFVVLDLLLHVATGRPWFGYDVEQGPTMYVVGEGARGVKKRVRAWERAHTHGVPVEDFYVLPRPVQVGGDEWMAFVGLCKEKGVRMIVMDTQARMTVGINENDATEMGTVVDMAEALRRETGAAVGFVHHTGYQGDHARGSTAVYGAMQTEIAVVRKADLRIEIKATKQKDDEELGPFPFVLEPEGDSLVIRNVNGDDVEVRHDADVQDTVRDAELEGDSHMERVAFLLYGLFNGGDGATKSELRRVTNEAYARAGLLDRGKTALAESSWYRTWTEMTKAGWLVQGATSSKYLLSEAGCAAIGRAYQVPEVA